MSFADILKQVTDEAERGQVESLATKYPVLRKFSEAGEVLENLRPALRTLDPEYETHPERAIQELDQWRGWKGKTWDATHNMTHQEYAAKTALATAEARITELEERTDTDMTPEEIKQIVKAALAEEGVVNSAALEARLTKALSPDAGDGKPGEVYGLVNQTQNSLGARFQEVYSTLEEKAEAHRTMFGEPLNRKAVFEYMQANKVWDANTAYDQMTATRRAEKLTADTAKQIEDAKKAGVEEGRRAALAASGGRAIPVDGKGGSMGLAEQRRMTRMKPKEGETFTPRLGQGIAQQHMRERQEQLAAAGAE